LKKDVNDFETKSHKSDDDRNSSSSVKLAETPSIKKHEENK